MAGVSLSLDGAENETGRCPYFLPPVLKGIKNPPQPPFSKGGSRTYDFPGP
jgi:hypothetical protein